MEPKFKIDDAVTVVAEVLYRDGEGAAQNIQLSQEDGVIKKVDDCCTYYVETQYGVHYLHESKLTAKPEPV